MRLVSTLFLVSIGSGVACSSSSGVTDAGAQDAASDNTTIADSANDAPDAAACHDVVNAAPIVQATEVKGPFPTGVGQGGAFTSGTYFLTSVVYYNDTDAGAPDGGDAGVFSVYWRTTIDLQVTIGTLANRTWHTGKLPDLSNTQEHREILVFDSVDTTTISLHSNCSDLPVAFTAEYTSTPTEFTIWIAGANRVETYTRQ